MNYKYVTKTEGSKNLCSYCNKKTDYDMRRRIGGTQEHCQSNTWIVTTTVFYACKECAKRCHLDDYSNCGHERSCDCDDIKKKA